ncbi:MAG: hypothetical protein E6471_04120, partial [Bradyrhizobium sp.]|nr:hypothetical protein [Bradyrhizobium sp.]
LRCAMFANITGKRRRPVRSISVVVATQAGRALSGVEERSKRAAVRQQRDDPSSLLDERLRSFTDRPFTLHWVTSACL